MTTKNLFIIVLFMMILPLTVLANKPRHVNHIAQKVEIKADRAFIRGDYDKAMKYYTLAHSKMADGTEQKLELELKMARLYILLHNTSEAIHYYNIVQQTNKTMLSVNDVCFYIDALRRNGQSQQAEIVARQYAFISPYSRNQRYLNTLYSLTDLQYYYKKGDSDYTVQLLEKSSTLPEYWIGSWNGEPFYAVSHSKLQDPLKIFYHQTQYFSLLNEKLDSFRQIPRELQSGPVAFSDNGKLMIATGISYRSKDRINNIASSHGLFVAQLYYSVIDIKSGSWKRFQPLFEYQSGHNYAHPVFFNEGKSLMFSSDCPGGYGGMDLYITHWDEQTNSWSEPINMGAIINTEGDEIYPRIVDEALYFASNGLEGYGGYDIYRVSFGHNLVLPGSLYHYPYPINTPYNDFGIFFDKNLGYFISDRRGITGWDDIYLLDTATSPLGNNNAVGVSAEYSAMAGNLNLITGLKSSNTQTFEKELLITPTYRIPDEGEILLSLYFEFNKHDLDTEAISALKALLENPALDSVKELCILGYADEFGTQNYNIWLSKQRAESVALYMNNSRMALPKLTVEGYGKLSLSPGEYAEELKQLFPNYTWKKPNVEVYNTPNILSFEERIKLNRKLRRVDIIVKRK